VSQRAFGALDAHLWRLAWKWAKFSHPNKPRRWIIARYFGMSNPARQDKWVLGSRETGFYLCKFAWTKIVRHRMVARAGVPGRPRPDRVLGPAATPRPAPVDPATWHLLRRQRGGCPLCRGLLLHADHQLQGPGEWQQWHTATRKAVRKHAIASVTGLGTPDERAAHHLIHIHRRHRISSGTNPALLPGSEPPGLLEPNYPDSGHGRLLGGGTATRRRYPTSDGFPNCSGDARSAGCSAPSTSSPPHSKVDQALERKRPALQMDQDTRSDHRPHLPLPLTHLRTGTLVVLGRNSAGDSARPSTGAVTRAVLHHARPGRGHPRMNEAARSGT
jgi:hypothetical protein